MSDDLEGTGKARSTFRYSVTSQGTARLPTGATPVTIPNYLRDELIVLDGPTRRGLAKVAHTRAANDPDDHNPMSRIWWAIWCQIIDLDADEKRLIESATDTEEHE